MLFEITLLHCFIFQKSFVSTVALLVKLSLDFTLENEFNLNISGLK